MDDQIVACRRYIETLVEFLLQHGLHFRLRVAKEPRARLLAFLGLLGIEVVQPAVASQQQHLLVGPVERLAFDQPAIHPGTKHELSRKRGLAGCGQPTDNCDRNDRGNEFPLSGNISFE